MKNRERGEEIKIIVDRMYDSSFMDLISSMHELEELGCVKECRKLDTILGKLENLCNELSDKAGRLMK